MGSKPMIKLNPQRILGIDPGYICTGYAVLEGQGQNYRHLGSGVIQLNARIERRLHKVFTETMAIIEEYQPHHLAIETPFFHRDASATLKLGYVCGSTICAAANAGLGVTEYTPRFVKKTIVGIGNASKEQTRFMVARLLQTAEAECSDEADAVAVALCHGYSQVNSALQQRIQTQ